VRVPVYGEQIRACRVQHDHHDVRRRVTGTAITTEKRGEHGGEESEPDFHASSYSEIEAGDLAG
jgi:hypothetical protein